MHLKTDPKLQRLFSPGPVPMDYAGQMLFSHRSREFQALFADTREHLTRLSGYKHVLFVQGSASSAIDTVLSSTLAADSRLIILVNGEFARRACEMAGYYTQHIKQVNDISTLESELTEHHDQYDFCFVVQFETSLSIYNDLSRVEELCAEHGVHLMADTVSAFPYYQPPRAKFMLSTSSKQLRGLPAMGLIFYDDIEDLPLIERSDYLNLKRYIKYAKDNQTPHTSLIPQFDTLNRFISTVDLGHYRECITANARALTNGIEDYILNQPISPVVTIKVQDAHTLVDKLHQRGISVYHNFFYMCYYIQVGCFNYDSPQAYQELNEYLRSQAPF
ncbi:MAG: aminotransferase class V-fold PLP-dependent enzyme [Candidatus Obscuribacterales bacterium]|jgi:aspartate aminotransferase-like enzyme|nr:aminotransferase class V-fold PLP-dependent enzyme [Candidatus Obscuribacterales bacterium]